MKPSRYFLALFLMFTGWTRSVSAEPILYTMKARLLGTAYALLLTFGAASNAYSAMIDNGLTTTDTSTNMEWLDVTATLGKSVNEVLSGYGGFIGSGYRYATTTEVISVWNELGISTLDQPFSLSLAAPVAIAQALFGLTLDAVYDGVAYKQTFGWTDPASAIGIADISMLGLDVVGDSARAITSGGCSGPGCVDFQQYDYGSWLVKGPAQPPSAAPSPATIPLLSLALAALGYSRRKRRQHI